MPFIQLRPSAMYDLKLFGKSIVFLLKTIIFNQINMSLKQQHFRLFGNWYYAVAAYPLSDIVWLHFLISVWSSFVGDIHQIHYPF